MKKVINNKVYDTDKAKRLGDWDNDCSTTDFHYCEETLYQKRTGEYFLYGCGGPMSCYAKAVGMNEWSGGEKIRPLSYDAARAWAEKNLDGDQFEEIFGEIVEDESKSAFTVTLPNALIERIRRSASAKGQTLSEYIESIITEQI